MVDIFVSSLGKYFGEKLILKDISFEIYEGQKAALVGKNGSGKTTLFNIIAGRLAYEEGAAGTHPSKKLGILEQMPTYPEDMSVKAVLESAFAPLYARRDELKELEKRMAAGDNDRRILSRYGELSQSFEAGGGYGLDTELQKVSNGLNISREMWQRPYCKLSGGEMTRVNLARMLLEKTDIMLLDEPTNHLDMSSLEWLEEYLEGYKGTVLVISHDRFFLDRVTKRTIELSDTRAAVYEGGYSFYAAQKEEEEALRQQSFERASREISRLTFTSKRMHGWGMGNSKLMRRAFALDKRIERLKAARPDPVKHEKKLAGRLEAADRSGNDVLFLDNLKMGYGDCVLFEDLSLVIRKDESIALLGDNGCGKTTLLKLLTGEEAPLSGFIKWGSNIKLAYLPQRVSFKDESLTALETLVAELGMSEPAARSRLGAYHFKGDDVYKSVSVLSGGEKSRLKLCILLNDRINTLILDEPTNHLDIDSREWLETLLEKFEGTMLFVSHDRYFTGRFATKVWTMENKGVTEFCGTYSEYRASLERERAAKSPAADKGESRQKSVRAERSVSPDKRIKKLERELEAQEEKIRAAEDEVSGLALEIEKNAYDHIALEGLCTKKEEAESNLNGLYIRWNEISESLEQIKKEATDGEQP